MKPRQIIAVVPMPKVSFAARIFPLTGALNSVLTEPVGTLSVALRDVSMSLMGLTVASKRERDTRSYAGSDRAKSRPPAPPSERESYRYRQQLLAAVENEVALLQQQSLHGAVVANLFQEQQQQSSIRPDAEAIVGNAPRFQLQPEDSIVQIFDQCGGKLLIFGGAGAGKTTLLQQLALELRDRAFENATAPVPVLFHLSSWRDREMAIAPWLLAELQAKYGIRPDVGQQWLENGQILPLLDGLDELELHALESCIQAIDRLLLENPQPLQLVVCTRYRDYYNCRFRLHLNGAILLRPLSETQIREYLLSARSRELWYNIEHEPQLLAVARTPLLLSMMTLAYEEILIHSWKRLTEKQDLREYIFNAYIRRQLGREIRQQPTPEKIRYWLSWLAKRMEEENRVEFSLENLQPSWLQTPAQQRFYRIGAMLLGGFVPGLAFIRHFLLRFILWRSGYIPWNYSRFLKLATERVFLQKAGDRYRFVHRLLQSHFAQLP